MKNFSISLALILILCTTAAGCIVITPPAPPLPVSEISNTDIAVHLPSGALPDAEYSAIPEPKRFYKDTMLGLVANNGYGRIYPYIGGITRSSFYSSANLFGFCDASGRIVCDPVYNRIELAKMDSKSYYLCTKNGDSDFFPDHVMLATTDGSIVTRFEAVNISLLYRTSSDTSASKYISAKLDGKWGLLDENLNTIIDFKYDNPLALADGLILVTLLESSEYAYMDISENIVLGPYPYEYSPEYYPGALESDKSYLVHVRSFENGKALMSTDDTFGYIDTSGAYTSYDDPKNGFDPDNIVLADNISYREIDGGIVLTIDGKETEYPSAFNVGYESDRLMIMYDDAWSLMDTSLNMYVEMRAGGAYFDNNTISFYNDNNQGVMDLNGSIIIPGNYRAVYNVNNLWAVMTSDTGNDIGTMGLIDSDFNEILPMIYREIFPLGDCICATTNNISTLVTPDGKILLTVSLLGSLD